MKHNNSIHMLYKYLRLTTILTLFNEYLYNHINVFVILY